MNRKISAEERKESDRQIRKLLDEIAARNRSHARAVKAGVPEAGIIFMLGAKILTSGYPITELPSCGGLKTYGTDHRDFWRTLQRMGAVPQDAVYDEVARGRVVYNTKTKQFHLMADPCILKNKTAVRKIINEFRLPAESTKTETDEHYRCPKCSKGKQVGNEGKRGERQITRSRK